MAVPDKLIDFVFAVMALIEAFSNRALTDLRALLMLLGMPAQTTSLSKGPFARQAS